MGCASGCRLGPHLLIARDATVSLWRREFRARCPSLQLIGLQGRRARRHSFTSANELRRWHVCIATLSEVCEALQLESEVCEALQLESVPWQYVVDEAELEDPLPAALSRLHSRYRLLLVDDAPTDDQLGSLASYLLPDGPDLPSAHDLSTDKASPEVPICNSPQ